MPIVIPATKKKKKDPFRADKTESLNKKFSKGVSDANKKAMKNVKKKMGGGMMNKKAMGYAGGGLTKGMMSKDVLLGKKSSTDVLKENKKKALKKKKIIKKAEGGSLKPIPEGNQGKGLSKLPTPVRNKMGFMAMGGKMSDTDKDFMYGGKMMKKMAMGGAFKKIKEKRDDMMKRYKSAIEAKSGIKKPKRKKRMMKGGASFTKAHNLAKKMVGK